jgi:putative ATP-binding cassette transporter
MRTSKNLRREADFRFGLVRLRENAEAIALYHGERQEKHHSKCSAGCLHFFYYGNSYLAMVLPTLIIAPRVLSSELEVGRIVQATGASGVFYFIPNRRTLGLREPQLPLE